MTGRVLLVDDGENWLETFRPGLEQEGYEVFWAPSRPKALEYLRAGDLPDVAIVNLNLTESLDHLGLQLLREIGTDWPNIPKIAVSSFSDDEGPGRALKLVNNYMVDKVGDKSELEIASSIVDYVNWCVRERSGPPEEKKTISVSNNRRRIAREARLRMEESLAVGDLDETLAQLRLCRPGLAVELAEVREDIGDDMEMLSRLVASIDSVSWPYFEYTLPNRLQVGLVVYDKPQDIGRSTWRRLTRDLSGSIGLSEADIGIIRFQRSSSTVIITFKSEGSLAQFVKYRFECDRNLLDFFDQWCVEGVRLSEGVIERRYVPPLHAVVFLCHAKEDRALADAVAQKLRLRGLRVWVDHDDLHAGDKWDAEIERVIENKISYFLVLQTETLRRRHEGYFFKEIALAVERARKIKPSLRFIIPLRVDDSATIEELASYQDVDLRESEGYNVLARILLEDIASRESG